MKIVDYAKYYAKKGFYVLPMSHKNKTPLIKFKDQPPLSIDEIEKIWNENPNAQIALRTVDFMVVDIDVHGDANGFESLKKYKNLSYFPETLTQTTGGGGRQMFFKKPDNFEVSQNIAWLKGVDIKAHHNNYIMVAPSQIVGKQPYKWDNKNKMAVLPEIILKDMQNNKPDVSNTSFSNYSRGQKTVTSYLFEQIVHGFEVGKRNDSLARFVGGLLVRNVGIEEVFTLSELANSNSEQPLEFGEFKRTFDSVLQSEMNRRKRMERAKNYDK